MSIELSNGMILPDLPSEFQKYDNIVFEHVTLLYNDRQYIQVYASSGSVYYIEDDEHQTEFYIFLDGNDNGSDGYVNPYAMVRKFVDEEEWIDLYEGDTTTGPLRVFLLEDDDSKNEVVGHTCDVYWAEYVDSSIGTETYIPTTNLYRAANVGLISSTTKEKKYLGVAGTERLVSNICSLINTVLPTNGTAGQVLTIGDDGKPTWGDAPSGGGSDDGLVELIDGAATEINNSKVENVRSYAFYSHNNLASVNLQNCSEVGNYAFYNCYNLSDVKLSNCLQIGSSAFYNCKNLSFVNMPSCTTIYTNAFNNCINLTSINVPMCSYIAASAFQSCSKLTSVNIDVYTKIYSYAFRSCYNLSTIVLKASSVCLLNHSNAFTSTPYYGYSASFSGTPYIYVPASLVDSYKTASHWSYYSKYFSAIEDMPI